MASPALEPSTRTGGAAALGPGAAKARSRAVRREDVVRFMGSPCRSGRKASAHQGVVLVTVLRLRRPKRQFAVSLSKTLWMALEYPSGVETTMSCTLPKASGFE